MRTVLTRWSSRRTRQDLFPAVHAVITEGMFDDGPRDGGDEGEVEDEFEFGLQRILDGIEAYMARRAG